MIDSAWSEDAVFDRLARSGLVWEETHERETVSQSRGGEVFKEQKEDLMTGE